MFPRWLSWLVLFALLYLVVTGVHRQREAAHTEPASSGIAAGTPDAETYPALAQATDMEHWKRAINPDYARLNEHCSLPPAQDGQLALHIVPGTEGEGDGAHCGETISLALVVWNAQGTVARRVETLLTLGEQGLASGLDSGLIGLKTFGSRTLILPPSAQKRTKGIKPEAALANLFPATRLVVVTVTRLPDRSTDAAR